MTTDNLIARLRPEWRLLLACCRRPAFPDGRERVRALLAADLDWSLLLRLAEEQGVAPLLAHALRAAGEDCVPEPWQEWLREHGRARICFTLALIAELFRLLEILGQASIEAAVFKGPALAVEAFGDAALRQYSDLDLFVPHAHVLRACDLFVARGYRTDLPLDEARRGRVPGQFLFTRHDALAGIELHTERTLRYIPRPLPVSALMARRTYVPIEGHRVPTFSAEDTLVLISIHGSKHLWDRLTLVADVGALACRAPQLDTRAALGFACELGAERMLALGLRLASDLLAAPLPGEFSRYAEQGASSWPLCRRVKERLLGEDRTQGGILGRAWFRLRMRGSLLVGLRYFLRIALAPTEEDWASRDTPKRSRLGAVIRRPLRLLRKYGIGFGRRA
jgi:hypothetical protein